MARDATHLDGTRDDLRRFTRDHHVSYDVVEEPAAKAGAPPTFEVRLFASQGDHRLGAPMCPQCVDLKRELQSFASTLVETVDAAPWADVMESPPVLYSSGKSQGPDQVSVSLHVLGKRPKQARRGSDEHLHALENGLRKLGVSTK